jgi:hypothetical protein
MSDLNRQTLGSGSEAARNLKSRSSNKALAKIGTPCYIVSSLDRGPALMRRLQARRERGEKFLFGFRRNPLKSPESDE